MKTYNQFVTEAATNSQMREWIIKQVEHSDRAHDEIKKDFDSKFAKGDKKLLAYFEKVVDSIVL